MDFLEWLQENDISFSLTESGNGWLFKLNDVKATDGNLVIDIPCNYGRTKYTAVALFLISYHGFFIQKGKKNLFIDSDVLEHKDRA
jgi:hypothetical protein